MAKRDSLANFPWRILCNDKDWGLCIPFERLVIKHSNECFSDRVQSLPVISEMNTLEGMFSLTICLMMFEQMQYMVK